MEYLVIAVILYFVVQATGNLVRIVRSNGGPTDPPASPSAQQDWDGPSPGEKTGGMHRSPTFWDRDVEDATWRDIGE